jgi:RES domain
MLTPARLARALKSLKRVTIHGPWTRAVRFHHLLGQAAYSDGSIAGIRYRSAKKHADGFCVVIFEDRLGLSSHNYLEVYDPVGRLDQRLP